MAKTSSFYHELSLANTKRQARQVEALQRVIDDSNPFNQEQSTLVNMVTSVMPRYVQHDILWSYETGKQVHDDFVAKRVVGPISAWGENDEVEVIDQAICFKDKKS